MGNPIGCVLGDFPDKAQTTDLSQLLPGGDHVFCRCHADPPALCDVYQFSAKGQIPEDSSGNGDGAPVQCSGMLLPTAF